MNANHQEMSQRMRIQCPSCSATYDVAAGLLEKPRTVRCAQCGQDWLATAMPGAEEDAPVAAPAADPDAAHHGAADPGPIAPPDSAPEAAAAPSPDDHAAAATHGAADTDLSFDVSRAQGADAARDRAEQAEDAAADLPPLSGIARLSTDDDPARVSGRRDRLLAPAWIVSISLLLAFFALGYVKRAQVMEHWPASKRAYAVLGLSPAAGEPSGEKH